MRMLVLLLLLHHIEGVCKPPSPERIAALEREAQRQRDAIRQAEERHAALLAQAEGNRARLAGKQLAEQPEPQPSPLAIEAAPVYPPDLFETRFDRVMEENPWH